MNLRLQSSDTAPATGAVLGSCGLHALALLLVTGLLASQTAVQLPRLDSLPAMTLAAPSAVTAPAPAPSVQKARPHPAAKPTPARPVLAPTPKPTPVAPTQARAAAATAKPASAEHPDTAPTSPATAVSAATTPAPTPVVHEPLYRGGYLNNPKPLYPPLSVEMEEAGTVRLRVQVSAQGLPVAVELEQGSGFPRLDRAALTAVRGWKFIPAKRGDEAIPYTFIVPVQFSLKNLRKP
ncbi:energy transducer TonB [Aquitalea aquatica]|uniref:Energy transducer TonB n=1 Tax=Aquitalea aquatica TaxID=3044273 RepID=A0A838Y3I1_9NEIS|nr:energy transducer TonB [Aquitalea magnusonii]MBA4708438.1 energy transducer TonB [Aquitalea magnusonii]